MASLSDLTSVYAPSGPEAGFRLGDIERQVTQAETSAGIGKERLLRNFNRFNLPALFGSQAARGAFNSSATQTKRTQLATGVSDQVSDIELGLANTKADLAAQALLAQTGVNLGQGGY